ncbi:anti-sigma factor family protein [Ktedonospora formicarum]|uniref:Putative zinc-finger domain-containing protein n=1 Tax=Ktedonospora formicarum TaxID=2778364 RepID=A0A8J3MRT6_9CHLR|nr:zf-HC2 domain-containing protein [Ktedonospora formicarum]GHO45340.1 hypothetical protein KSX_35030 [Ktedonospora formicarum]
MKCEQVKELLSIYLDGQLAAEAYQRITNHLRHCRSCSNTLADFRYLDTILSQMPRVEPDATLYTRIFASSPTHRSLNIYAQGQQSTLPPFARPGRPHLVSLPGGRTSLLPLPTIDEQPEERTTDKVARISITTPLALISSTRLLRLALHLRLRRYLLITCITCSILLAFLAGLFIGIHL